MDRTDRRRWIKAARRHLAEANARWGASLEEVPREIWPPNAHNEARFNVLRSHRFLVQLFEEPDGVIRLSANRTALTDSGEWDDRISWEELQALKAECGFADRQAVELYPPERDVVNVANMRHLWILPKPLPFGWRNEKGGHT